MVSHFETVLDLAEEFKLEFAGDSINKDEQLPVAFEFAHDSPEPEFHGFSAEEFFDER